MSKRHFGTIRKLPSGRWQARYRRPNGAMVSAHRTFASKADAARYLSNVEVELARGLGLDPEGQRLTVAEWAARWGARPGRRPSSMVRDCQALRAFMDALGPLRLGSVTPLIVQAAVDARAEAVSPATLARDFASLRALFNAAVDAALLAKSPARPVKLPVVLPPQRIVFGPEDLARLVVEVPERYQALILVGAVLGLRWGEAVGLRRCDVDLDRSTLAVAQTVEELQGKLRIVLHGKTRTSIRTMTMPVFVRDALAAHIERYQSDEPAPEALVFLGTKGGILRRNFVERILQPAAERAGLPPLSFHALRHQAVSAMAEAGVPYSVTQARAGHSTARMTMELYSHRSHEADLAAARSLDDHFGAAFVKQPHGSQPKR